MSDTGSDSKKGHAGRRRCFHLSFKKKGGGDCCLVMKFPLLQGSRMTHNLKTETTLHSLAFFFRDSVPSLSSF